MKKIKIVFFLPQLVSGGAEKVTMNIMKILDKNLFDVHLIITTKKYSVYDSIPEGIILHNLNVSKTMFSLFKLRKLINFLEPNILFSTLLRGHIALNIALQGLNRKPYIILRSPNSPKLLFKNNQIGYIQNVLLNYAYKKADLVLAQTPEMKEEILNYYDVKKSNIEVFLNPLDVDMINEQIKNIKNPFNTENINVIAAGRLSVQKGFDILIQSFVNIIEKNSKFHLFIIGEDDGEEESLRALVKKLSLEKNIHFLGYQTNPYKYYYFADVYVLSSRWEGLPNTVLENIYLKKPIVATRCIPFMNEIIKNKENGFLVDVENIEQMSNAILNYKDIVIDKREYIDRKKEINELFFNFQKRI